LKGIILAGGSGTRLHPLTKAVSKQLLPIYNKPMIYYPMSVLMLAGITEILIISTPHDLPLFEKLFGSGATLGLKLSYVVQPSPDGLAQAFTLGKSFIGSDSVCLVLGDNIFYGHGLSEVLKSSRETVEKDNKSVVFGYYVHDPERYGVVEFNDKSEVLSIEEKPKNPKSNYAVVGLYFYTNDVVQKAENLKPSARGELEITDLNNVYLIEKKLSVELLGRGYAWLDTGTHQSLIQASNFIQTIEERTGLSVANLDEIAFQQKFIDKTILKTNIESYGKSEYGVYLKHFYDRLKK
jgi:glucose-1-phosphate thymidylyltransferase